MPTGSLDILRVAARQLVDGTDEVVNVFHFQVLTPGTGGDQAVLDEIGAHMSNAWVEIAAHQPNNLTPNIIDVYNVTDDYPLGQVPWEGAYTGGSSGGEYLPLQVALLVLWSTATKRVQGKTYLGPFAEGDNADGSFVGATVTAVANWCTAMLDPIPLVDDWGLQLGVYSKGAGVIRPIVTRRIVTNPATLRRRRRGRGS